jgi:hypothetical protein
MGCGGDLYMPVPVSPRLNGLERTDSGVDDGRERYEVSTQMT